MKKNMGTRLADKAEEFASNLYHFLQERVLKLPHPVRSPRSASLPHPRPTADTARPYDPHGLESLERSLCHRRTG